MTHFCTGDKNRTTDFSANLIWYQKLLTTKLGHASQRKLYFNPLYKNPSTTSNYSNGRQNAHYRQWIKKWCGMQFQSSTGAHFDWHFKRLNIKLEADWRPAQLFGRLIAQRATTCLRQAGLWCHNFPLYFAVTTRGQGVVQARPTANHQRWRQFSLTNQHIGRAENVFWTINLGVVDSLQRQKREKL